LITKFKRILSPEKAAETAGNKKLSVNLSVVLDSLADADPAPFGPLLYFLASTVTKNAVENLPFIAQKIRDGSLLTNDQIAAAIKFCDNSSDPSADLDSFNKSCGVGVMVSPAEIKSAIATVLKSKEKELKSKRYTLLGQLLSAVRAGHMRWANAASVKEELDAQMLAILGEKDDRDDMKKKKEKEKQAKAVLQKESSDTKLPASPTVTMAQRAQSVKFTKEGELSRLHKAGENPQINSDLMQAHLSRTKGQVITRFPPEPNGFLHIGHAKAINVNFAYAQANGGLTNLRYDDTNPEAEEQRYFDSILESVKWLGFTPDKITYSSDHFGELYELACQLVVRDKAYVCHCTGEQIFEHRGGVAKGPRTACAHRDRPIEESLHEFERMKNGEYKVGEAILRMKMDLENPNPQFWDLVAYRVMFTAHHRTSDTWCIYPTYDYTHCLVDSFEDITHSMCTTEFVLSRESYYWLCDVLEVYKPVQWEYGRLKLTNTVLSKRKLNKLVTDGHVAGWDDPRLHTLDALRRRGFTPEAINAFVRELGVTTSNTTIEMSRLEGYVRDHLNEICPRLQVVLDPIRINITNLGHGHIEELVVPNKPKDDSMGTRIVPFGREIYIDASDFREESDPDFFRLTVGGSVGLLYVPFPIRCTGLIKDSTGKILEVQAVYESEGFSKPKTYIQWIGASSRHASPVPVEIRLYDSLFNHSDPDNKELVPGGWLSDLNPNSLEIKKGLAEVGVRGVKAGEKFQFVRVGYFCVDNDSADGNIVFNRTVGLKEDSKKT